MVLWRKRTGLWDLGSLRPWSPSYLTVQIHGQRRTVIFHDGICWPQGDGRPLGRRRARRLRKQPALTHLRVHAGSSLSGGTSPDLDCNMISRFLRKTDLRFEIEDVVKLCYKPESQYFFFFFFKLNSIPRIDSSVPRSHLGFSVKKKTKQNWPGCLEFKMKPGKIKWGRARRTTACFYYYYYYCTYLF